MGQEFLHLSISIHITFEDVTLQSFPILVSSVTSIFTDILVKSYHLHAGFITIYLVFLTFKDSLFAQNQCMMRASYLVCLHAVVYLKNIFVPVTASHQE